MIALSTIIPTVGRPSLSRAVESVLSQDLPSGESEIIVINDSGSPLPEADWGRSGQVQVIHTNRRERSVARNTGASVARGRYLHFLDDDDWLAPDAFQHLDRLSQKGPVAWLYGATQLVDRQGDPTIQLHHRLNGNCFIQAMAGEWIPLQSSWIDRTVFMQIGGFNPLLAGPEDVDLLRRILLVGDVAETPHIISHVVMGQEGSTTDYNLHSSASRRARELILDMPQTFRRMRASAADPFWSGRMLRVYLTSSVWNMTHRRLFSAISRLFFSGACLLFAGKYLLSPSFWTALSKPYESVTFEKGLRVIKEAS